MYYSVYACEQQLGLESATKMCLYEVPLRFGLDMSLWYDVLKGKENHQSQLKLSVLQLQTVLNVSDLHCCY
jgi:hypothetical protein